jgi:enterochelin esterase family protein
MPERPGRIVLDRFESQRLRGNRHGDPAARTIPVYLPPGYDGARDRYAVVYWLHGFGQTALWGVNGNAWVPSLPQCMDRIIGEGAPETLLVMVDGFTRFGGAQYLNSPANGMYEDYIIEELIPYIDRTYRTKPDRRHRGVDGKSSGGYGALALAMRHPQTFSAVGSHSGDIYFEACYRPLFWPFLNAVNRAGGVDKFLDHFLTLQKKDDRAYVAALSMCYSPNPNRPPYYFDLPVDIETGEILPEVWARWTALDPVFMAEPHADALRSMRTIYLDCGNRDQYFGHFGARLLSRRLTRLGISHEYLEYEDDHLFVNYRYVESLHRIAVALA